MGKLTALLQRKIINVSMKSDVRRFKGISLRWQAFFVLCAAVIGVVILGFSNAATSSVSIEVEGGNVLSPAQAYQNSSTASGASAVKFIAGGTSNPGDDTTKKCSELTNLQFCDDFDGAAGTAPDSSKWSVMNNRSSWGSHCFRNASENIAMDGNGNLRQTMINKGTTQCTDSNGNATTVTSAGMDTDGKKYFKYGKFEIRAKISCAKSVWGSIWTSTGNDAPDGWPTGGEIDIYEKIDAPDNQNQQTIWAGNPKWHVQKYATVQGRLCDAFHVYGMEWRPGYIAFFMNGKETNRMTKAVEGAGKTWPFDTHNQRFLLTFQIGGPGFATSKKDMSELPTSTLYDYVRIYN